MANLINADPTAGLKLVSSSSSDIQIQSNGVTVCTINADGLAGDGSQLTSLPVLGVGQTWQLVTGSRAASTTYTNTTGKPIAISIRAETTATAVADALFVVGGVNAWNRYCGSIASARFSIMAIVPTGATYYLTIPTGTVFDQWAELR